MLHNSRKQRCEDQVRGGFVAIVRPGKVVKNLSLHECAVCSVAQSYLTFCDPWTVAHQASLSMGFSRQESWSGLTFPSPGDLPDPGTKPMSPGLQANSSPLSHLGNPVITYKYLFPGKISLLPMLTAFLLVLLPKCLPIILSWVITRAADEFPKLYSPSSKSFTLLHIPSSKLQV